MICTTLAPNTPWPYTGEFKTLAQIQEARRNLQRSLKVTRYATKKAEENRSKAVGLFRQGPMNASEYSTKSGVCLGRARNYLADLVKDGVLEVAVKSHNINGRMYQTVFKLKELK